MENLTLFEAKQVAAYLKTSNMLVSQHAAPLKHGQWLNTLASSCGYRDWNAMSARATDIPKTDWGEWYGAFFAIARVITTNADTFEHVVWCRNYQTSHLDVVCSLAKEINARTGESFRGKKFSYSRPDRPESPGLNIVVHSLNNKAPRSERVWSEDTPLVIQSADGNTKILLWWLYERYTQSEFYPTKERRFRFHSLHFSETEYLPYDWSDPFKKHYTLTEQLLFTLSGVTPDIRNCYYVTELPNGPDQSFIPIVVQEGSQDATLLNLNFGRERWRAYERVQHLNFELGVTVSDSEAISHYFRLFEPSEDDFPIDFAWQGSDD